MPPAQARTGGRGASAGGDDYLTQLLDGIERTSALRGQKAVRRGTILVCAQSNAALDELIGRLLGGWRGRREWPHVYTSLFRALAARGGYKSIHGPVEA